jgi:hypothetical protein
VILALAVGIGGMSCGGGDDSVLMVPVTPATVAAPVAYPPGGTTVADAMTVANGQVVTLSTPTDGAVIYYTTDGSDPKTAPVSTLQMYDPSVGVSLPGNTTGIIVRAIAKTTGQYDSAELRAVYTTSDSVATGAITFTWKATGATDTAIVEHISSGSLVLVGAINNGVSSVQIKLDNTTSQSLETGGTATLSGSNGDANRTLTVNTSGVSNGGIKTVTLKVSETSKISGYYTVSVLVGAPIPGDYRRNDYSYGSTKYTVSDSKITLTTGGTEIITGLSTSPGAVGSFVGTSGSTTGRWDYVYQNGYRVDIVAAGTVPATASTAEWQQKIIVFGSSMSSSVANLYGLVDVFGIRDRAVNTSGSSVGNLVLSWSSSTK